MVPLPHRFKPLSIKSTRAPELISKPRAKMAKYPVEEARRKTANKTTSNTRPTTQDNNSSSSSKKKRKKKIPKKQRDQAVKDVLEYLRSKK